MFHELQKTLTRVLGELQVPLSYFRDLSVITNKIGMSSIYSNESSEKNLEMEYDLYSEELSSIVTRVFECIQFFRSHVRQVSFSDAQPSYKDSESYLDRYSALLNRIYSILRNKFSSLLKTCEVEIQEKADKNELLLPSCPLYYYMTALSRGNTQLISHIMEVHAGTVSELSGSSCFELYCSTRESLIEPLVTAELEAYLNGEETLESRIRSAILFTIEVCEQESEEYLRLAKKITCLLREKMNHR